MDITAIAGGTATLVDASGGDARGDGETPSWADRLVEAASDFEGIAPESLAGLGCDGW